MLCEPARTMRRHRCRLPCWHAPSHDPDHRRDPGTGRRRLRWSVGARVGGHGARRLHRQPRHHVLATDGGGVRPRRSDRGARTGWPGAGRVAGPGDADRADDPQHLSRWRARAARVHPRSRRSSPIAACTCTTPAMHPAAPGGCVNRVSRFTMQDVIDPASEAVLVDDISSRRRQPQRWRPRRSDPTATSTSRSATPGATRVPTEGSTPRATCRC